jgi:hypothetical protein
MDFLPASPLYSGDARHYYRIINRMTGFRWNDRNLEGKKEMSHESI